MKLSRRSFVQKAGMAAVVTPLSVQGGFNILKSGRSDEGMVIGQGEYRYRVDKEWGNLDPSKNPVKNCHEMVMDSKGRLIMVTDEVKNNIIIYDKSGKLLDFWGDQFPGGHGLSLHREGGEDFLYICDYELGKVFKTTTDGRVLLTIEHPSTIGIYKEDDPFKPTETAIGPNGDIYVADGYGSQYILQYNSKG